MQDAPSRGVEISHTTQSWLRVLIASYFIAVAIGAIPGTDFTILFGLIADPGTANLLTAIVVFTLAYMVMIGCYLRVAALLLGMMTFFSAFVIFVGPQGGGDLGTFWRDIALVSALMLTYATKARLRRSDVPRPAAPRSANIADLAVHRARLSTTRPMDVRAPLGEREIENIFLDYAEAR